MKNNFKLFFFLSFLFFISHATKYYVSKSGDGNFYLAEGTDPNSLAYGEYHHSMWTIGWNNLTVSTNPTSGASDVELGKKKKKNFF